MVVFEEQCGYVNELTSVIAGGSKCGIAAGICPFLIMGSYTAIGVTPLMDGTTNE